MAIHLAGTIDSIRAENGSEVAVVGYGRTSIRPDADVNLIPIGEVGP